MKIVHINFGLQTGGLETMLVDILNEQCLRADLHLILINEQVDAGLLAGIDARVTVWRVSRPVGSRNPVHIIRLNTLLYRLRPDVVHCHNHQVARLLWQRTRQRCLTIHDVQVPGTYFGRYDKLFAISDVVRLDVQQRTGLDAQRVYNGIRTGAITQKNTYTTDSLFRIVQVSRLQHEKKGQHILLEALHQLIHTHKMTNIHVDFVGEGDSRAYLEQLVHDRQLTDHVHFRGLQTRAQLYQHLQQYHLLIQPSLYEGFGLTVAEAMVAGLPVLVSNIDGPMELIDNDRYGYSFRAGDAGHLTDRIRTIIAGYQSDARHTMTTQARQHARDTFDVRQTAGRYLEHYHQPA